MMTGFDIDVHRFDSIGKIRFQTTTNAVFMYRIKRFSEFLKCTKFLTCRLQMVNHIVWSS